MNNPFLIKYDLGNTFLEKLNAKTKILLFLICIVLLMVSFDFRIILPSFLFNLILFLSLRTKTKAVKIVIIFVFFMNLFNIFLFYLVNPTIGNEISGKYTLLMKFNNFYVITYETLFYFLVRMLKVMGSLFISLWFILSITPSELALGVYKCGLPYKYSTMLSLGLRYIPDIYRDFSNIKESMQMRGLELDSKKASLMKRIKANIKILLPLILISFEKVDIISSAMDLRGYGHEKTRTYYQDRENTYRDNIINGVIALQLIVVIIYFYLKFTNKIPEFWVF